MALEAHIAELADKHQALERRLSEELARPKIDEIKIKSLKREKLRLKDAIARLKSPMSRH